MKSILGWKVCEYLDIEKTQSSLLARTKLLGKHASESTIPLGLQIQWVRAKGQNADMLQADYKDIIHDAELKLTDTLHNDVEACQEAIQEWEKDIIAQWKTHLLKVKKSLLSRWISLSNWLPLLLRNYLLTAPSLKLPNHCKKKLLRVRENGRIWTQTSNLSQHSLRFVKSSARRFTMSTIPIQPLVITKERFLTGEVSQNINNSNSASCKQVKISTELS